MFRPEGACAREARHGPTTRVHITDRGHSAIGRVVITRWRAVSAGLSVVLAAAACNDDQPAATSAPTITAGTFPPSTTVGETTSTPASSLDVTPAPTTTITTAPLTSVETPDNPVAVGFADADAAGKALQAPAEAVVREYLEKAWVAPLQAQPPNPAAGAAWLDLLHPAVDPALFSGPNELNWTELFAASLRTTNPSGHRPATPRRNRRQARS